MCHIMDNGKLVMWGFDTGSRSTEIYAEDEVG